jgi:Fic family protein
MFKDKYEMTVEENIFVAKRNIVDYIWKGANLEGIAVTYPDTLSIYNGLSVKGMKVEDIIAINNLKRAWSFILEHTDYEIDFNFICAINQKVGGDNLIHRAGLLRKVPISIGGTSWKLDPPIESKIKEDIEEIKTLTPKTHPAIEMMLYLMRSQMFLDGNKRTSMLAANHIMVSGGVGIISIPIELQADFTNLLVKYYESGDNTTVKKFIYDHCIDGIDFREQDRRTNENERPSLF